MHRVVILLSISIEAKQIFLTIKSQALTDFMDECIGFQEEPGEEPVQALWRIFVDGSSNKNRSGAGIILISPEGHHFHSALRFGFEASNNEAKYEALLAGLRVARKLKVSSIQCYSDSQLVVN